MLPGHGEGLGAWPMAHGHELYTCILCTARAVRSGYAPVTRLLGKSMERHEGDGEGKSGERLQFRLHELLGKIWMEWAKRVISGEIICS